MGRISILSVLAASTAFAVSAQPHRISAELSTRFLAQLVQDRLKPSQVAIIHANVGSAMIISGDMAEPVAYIRGADSFVWFQIEKQLSESIAQQRPVRLEMAHRSIDIATCPAMVEPITEFLAQLNAFDPNRSSGSADVSQEIMVDAAAFLIIRSLGDARITVEPNAPLDPPLQQAAGKLHSVVSRCAGSVPPQVQQHDF